MVGVLCELSKVVFQHFEILNSCVDTYLLLFIICLRSLLNVLALLPFISFFMT